MCECGCGDLKPFRVFEITKNKYVVIGNYFGCDYCGGVIAHDIYFFDKKGLGDYADWVKPEKVEFNEYGGADKSWYGLPLLDVDNFKKVIDENNFGDINDYDSIADWLEDYGLELIQKSIYKVLGELKEKG